MRNVLAEAKEELRCWDLPETRENIILVVSDWIKNLESYKDKQMIRQINEYKQFLCVFVQIRKVGKRKWQRKSVERQR